jgi:hypothetical protein
MDIKKFNNFIDHINESFESPADIEWKIDGEFDLDGEFYIDDMKYIIECYNWVNNIWTYKFSRIENDDKIMDLVEDSGRKMRVLSTIRSGMRHLIEQKNPNGLIINVIDGSRGRDYLWGRFSKEISEQYNYELSNKMIMGYSTFFLWRDISFHDVNASFNKMIRVFQNQ